MTSSSEKTEKSLAELLVTLTLIGIMMAVLIKFFIKNESQFTQASFTTIAQTFNTKVTAVHAQWMMDKQPDIVYLATLNNKEKQAVPVNKAGWIDVAKTQFSCGKIWQLVMDMPINEMKFPVSAVEIHTSSRKYDKEQPTKSQRKSVNYEKSECRYIMHDDSYFQYDRAKGKVSKVIKLNK
jgi:hypothetical protein